MYPHVIRLRDPWNRTSDGAAVELARRFNSPTGLDVREQLWLVVRGLQLPASIACNGIECGQLDGKNELGEFEITGCLRPRNEVRIRVTGDDHLLKQLAFESVHLEIRLGPANQRSAESARSEP